MLIEFTVSNFRSIKEPQTLSMLATSLKEHPDNVFQSPDPNIKLLKTEVIYGANASGKSNLIDGFNVLRELISMISSNPLTKLKLWDAFAFDRKVNNLPTTFEIEFFGADKVRYNYKIVYDYSSIKYESLFYYPKGKRAKLFEREDGEKIDFGDSLKGLKGSIAQQLLPNQVFLNKAANNNNEHLKEVFIALRALLQSPWNDYQYLVNQTSESILMDNSGELKNKVKELLSSFDTGIQGLSIKTKGGAPFEIIHGVVKYLKPNADMFEIQTKHKLFDGDTELEGVEVLFDIESYGTRRLYGLGGYILSLMNSGVAIIIDELNSSFHPLMTEAIIKLFHNPETNPNNAQLIFTTHDTSILRNDLFRRDQVWFTEKDGYGATSLFSLAEFDFKEVRKNVPFDKWYLSGRFGAIPMIMDFNYNTLENEVKEDK